MRLVKYFDNPLNLFDNFHQEIDRLFDASLGRFALLKNEALTPRVDISEDKNNIYVDTDLPGFVQKDINVKIKGNTLTITAKKEKVEEKKKKNYYRCERFQGDFYRSLILPKAVDSSKIKGKYKSGILHLTFPKKKKEVKEKQIDITVN